MVQLASIALALLVASGGIAAPASRLSQTSALEPRQYSGSSDTPSYTPYTGPSTDPSTDPSSGASTDPSSGASTDPSSGTSTDPSSGASTNPYGSPAPASPYSAPSTTPVSHDLDDNIGQGTGSGLLAGVIGAVIQGAGFMGGPPLVCNDFVADGQQYYYVGNQASNGLYWLACFQNDTEPVLFGQNEVDVANCLMNLHYTQADTCISVAGSSCDNGYVAGGGRLQNLREMMSGSGYQAGAQISADESSAFQEAIAAVNGQTVTGSGGQGPLFFITTDNTYSSSVAPHDNMQVNWIGETAC